MTCLVTRCNSTSLIIFVVTINWDGRGTIWTSPAAQITAARARRRTCTRIDRCRNDASNRRLVVTSASWGGMRLFDVRDRRRSIWSSDHWLSAHQRFECKSKTTTPSDLIMTSSFVCDRELIIINLYVDNAVAYLQTQKSLDLLYTCTRAAISRPFRDLE